MILSIKNVFADYGTVSVTHALNGISLGIEAADTVAIMGKSGSGKTTLLNVIGGLMPPCSGEVLFEGRDIYSLREKDLCDFRLLNVGYVYQAYDLFPELTAYENIILPVLLSGKKACASLADEICGKIGIGELKKRSPMEMSGGEQQRVAIARAMINRPKLLLCDEPTGNLDALNSALVIETILNMRDDFQTTVVVVTHDSDVAKRCDRVIHISDGMSEDS